MMVEQGCGRTVGDVVAPEGCYTDNRRVAETGRGWDGKDQQCTEDKFAKIEMMNSGTVLKKQTRTRMAVPIVDLRARSPSVMFMLRQTCTVMRQHSSSLE